MLESISVVYNKLILLYVKKTIVKQRAEFVSLVQIDSQKDGECSKCSAEKTDLRSKLDQVTSQCY